jgi:HPt (histidine-containing phosphotransfer) domain-containing protein
MIVRLSLKNITSFYLQIMFNYIDILKIKKLREFMSEDQINGIFDQFFNPNISGKQAVSDAFLANDRTSIINAVHSLKGAASFIGLSSITEYCQKIESQIDEETLNASLLDGFEFVWKESQREVEELLRTINP